MHIVHEFAGFSLGPADLLRRAVGRKAHSTSDAGMSEFRSGMRASGYSEEAADALWGLLFTSSDYVFSRAHSVSHTLITYFGAYLRAHFPEEFHEGITCE